MKSGNEDITTFEVETVYVLEELDDYIETHTNKKQKSAKVLKELVV